MRNSRRSTRRLVAVVPAAMLIGLGALIAGCGNNESPAPSSTTTTTTTPTTSTTVPSSAPVSPTEKDLSPTGGNLFTPPVKAEPAPTEPPGVHRK
jgi:hypothetical protein